MVSVIIPVYNEERAIKQVLDNVLSFSSLEVIVVDGGSSDCTLQEVSNYPVKLVNSKRGRAVQMNRGAEIAGGDILLFLHADCLLSKRCLEAIEQAVKRGYIAGCLSQRINASSFIFRLIEASGNLRAKLFKIFYGDQAIFVLRDYFFKAGGYDQVELFEDVLFSRKLKKMGPTCILKEKVYSSARRWQKQGVIKASLINWVVSLGFLLRISPYILSRIYTEVR